jgi:hypothetical protein
VPDLLAFLLLLLPDLLALQALLRLLPALLLRSPRILLPLLLLGSLISLRWVRSTIHAPSSLWLVFARSRCSCSQRETSATLFPPVRKSRPRRGHDTSSAYYLTLTYSGLRTSDTLHKNTCRMGSGQSEGRAPRRWIERSQRQYKGQSLKAPSRCL